MNLDTSQPLKVPFASESGVIHHLNVFSGVNSHLWTTLVRMHPRRSTSYRCISTGLVETVEQV